ncbi:DUF4148 domain-containing protein [Paraburkholderia sp. XV]|uniref:DUF4148 domain-containing protein n=1 Tax=Paraburkholderia sp. XV TaxID=2831520 RepID=UPI001CD473A0|nr:DUF4148 domain-containing protein [Paraburkholderia sp. XV]
MKFPFLVAVTVLGLISGANAFAQASPDGLTRAQVHAQLLDAEADGLLPVPKNDYPPSAQTIARNKELYATDNLMVHKSVHADSGRRGNGSPC